VTALLEVKDLELAYGQVAVCRGISLRLDRGEIVALIGANGAGKSTTLRAIAGLLPPRVGTIIFSGKDVTAMPSYERSKLGIALVPEGRRVFPFLTVRENLELGGFNVRNDAAKIRQRLDGVFAMFPRLSERTGQNAGTLSGGEQQMLALGRAMMSEPQLLCLTSPHLALHRSSFRTFSRKFGPSTPPARACCLLSRTPATRLRLRAAATSCRRVP
jgi:branched-chain amino acid transport system ATP-binding protein